MQKTKIIPSYEFLNLVKNQKPLTSYFIFGPENYLRDKVIKAIVEKFKTPGADDFDLVTFYGDDISANSVLDTFLYLKKNHLTILMPGTIFLILDPFDITPLKVLYM